MVYMNIIISKSGNSIYLPTQSTIEASLFKRLPTQKLNTSIYASFSTNAKDTSVKKVWNILNILNCLGFHSAQKIILQDVLNTLPDSQTILSLHPGPSTRTHLWKRPRISDDSTDPPPANACSHVLAITLLQV